MNPLEIRVMLDAVELFGLLILGMAVGSLLTWRFLTHWEDR